MLNGVDGVGGTLGRVATKTRTKVFRGTLDIIQQY